MRKYLYIALAFLLSAFNIYSEDMRGCKGFWELYGGIGVGTSDKSIYNGYYSVSNFGPDFSIGMNFTGGYQITDFLFAGVGFGIYTVADKYDVMAKETNMALYDSYNTSSINAIMLPIYADCRWVLNINRKINPFVDLKIGYQFRSLLRNSDIDSPDTADGKIHIAQNGGFYCMPTIGVRFGSKTAFNLGFSYNPTIRQTIFYKNPESGSILNNYNQGTIMLSLGVDF